ncbi:MAG: DNA repair protein RecO [Bacillales bacterium]
MIEYTGILISLNNYKDNDAIGNLLTKDGRVTFYIRNLFSKNNKFYYSLKPFLFGKFEFYKGPLNGYKLKDLDIIKDYSLEFKEFNELLLFDFINELIFKFMINQEEDTKIYDLLKLFLNKIENKNFLFFNIISLFSLLLKISGLKINFCIESNDTIEDNYIFNIKEGIIKKSFYINTINDSNIINIDGNILKILYYSFKNINFDNSNLYAYKKDFVSIINILSLFTKYYLNIELNSINNINLL